MRSLDESIPPQALDAERAVLGSAMISRAAVEHVVANLRPSDFYVEAHRRFYGVLVTLLQQEVVPDMVTVPEELRRRDQLDACGGQAYVNELINSVPTAAHVAYYAGIVREKAQRRYLIDATYRIQALAWDEGQELAAVVGQAEGLVYEASRKRGGGEFLTAGEQSHAALEWLAAPPEDRQGVTTGFWSLDRALGGLKASRLYVLAGRPGAGKTAAAAGILLGAARAGVPSALFSLEMERDDLWTRLLAMTARIDGMQLEAGELSDEERQRVWRANAKLGDLPFHLNDDRELTLLQLRGHARRLKRQAGIGLFIVDYLQLVQPERGQEADVRHYTAVAEGLKSMARELEVPVLALAQLSRSPERRENKRPIPSDLRESGGIEQAADAVLLLYRENYHRRQQGEDVPGPDDTEFNVAKARQGRVGMVKLAYHPQFLTFAELERGREAPPEGRPLDDLRDRRRAWGGDADE